MTLDLTCGCRVHGGYLIPFAFHAPPYSPGMSWLSFWLLKPNGRRRMWHFSMQTTLGSSKTNKTMKRGWNGPEKTGIQAT